MSKLYVNGVPIGTVHSIKVTEPEKWPSPIETSGQISMRGKLFLNDDQCNLFSPRPSRLHNACAYLSAAVLAMLLHAAWKIGDAVVRKLALALCTVAVIAVCLCWMLLRAAWKISAAGLRRLALAFNACSAALEDWCEREESWHRIDRILDNATVWVVTGVILYFVLELVFALYLHGEQIGAQF